MSVYDKYAIDIQKVKKELLGSYVSVYGEEFKNLIEERLNNSHFVQYITPLHFAAYLNSLIQSKRDELAIKFLHECGIIGDYEKQNFENNPPKFSKYKNEYGGEILKDIFNTNSFNEISNNLEILSFEQGVEIPSYKKVKVLGHFGAKNVNLSNLEQLLNQNKLEKPLSKIFKAQQFALTLKGELEEYKTFLKENYKEEYQEAEECQKQIFEATSKAYKNYVEQMYLIMPKDEKEKIFPQIIDFKNGNISQIDSTYISSGLYSKPIIEVFSSSSDELLKKDELSKKYIQTERMKYIFDVLGMTFKLDYEKLMEDESVRAICEKAKMIANYSEKVKEKIVTYLNQDKTEIVLKNTYYKNKREIDNLNLVGNDLFYKEYLMDNRTYSCTNLVKRGEKYKQIGLIYVPMLMAKHRFYEDNILVHEFGHIVEGDVYYFQDGKGYYTTGFEKICLEDNSEEYLLKNPIPEILPRDYQCLSEAINERITKDVLFDLHLKGKFLVSDEKTCEDKNHCRYEKNFSMIEDFYQTFKPEILKSRMSHDNLQDFVFRIGQNEFNQFAGLVKEYETTFGKTDPFTLIFDSAKMQRLDDIHKKRDELVKKMSNNFFGTSSQKVAKSGKTEFAFN